jgi:hypothetical protein
MATAAAEAIESYLMVYTARAAVQRWALWNVASTIG